MQEREELFSQNDAEGPNQRWAHAIVTERETKPHSAHKSNREIIGNKTDSACLVVAEAFVTAVRASYRRDRQRLTLCCPPFPRSEAIPRAWGKECCGVEEVGRSSLPPFSKWMVSFTIPAP